MQKRRRYQEDVGAEAVHDYGMLWTSFRWCVNNSGTPCFLCWRNRQAIPGTLFEDGYGDGCKRLTDHNTITQQMATTQRSATQHSVTTN